MNIFWSSANNWEFTLLNIKYKKNQLINLTTKLTTQLTTLAK